MQNDRIEPEDVLGFVFVVVAVVVMAVCIYHVATRPTAGTVTEKSIVPARTDWEYAPVIGGESSGVLIPVYKPAAWRITIQAENGRINHFDVPESVYRLVKIGERFDSRAMPDSG